MWHLGELGGRLLGVLARYQHVPQLVHAIHYLLLKLVLPFDPLCPHQQLVPIVLLNILEQKVSLLMLLVVFLLII